MKIKRDRYLKILKSREGNGQIKIITGMRGCGKSYLMCKLLREHLSEEGVAEDHFIEVALDDRSNKALRDTDRLLEFLKEKIQDDERYYIVLDELQRVSEYEEVLDALRRMENVEVYAIFCSAAYISTSLRAHSDEIRVYPLSFAEYMSVYDGRLYQGWNDYLLYGGMPLIFTRVSPQDCEEYLTTQINRVCLPDVIKRYAIRSKSELEELVNMLVTTLGALSNPLKYSEMFRQTLGKKVSDKTIKKFLDYLEEAFIIRKAPRYEIRGRKFITSASKYYFEDIGLRNARLRFQGIEEKQIIENIIHNEIASRGYQVESGLVEAYEKDVSRKFVLKRLEVDFVADRGSDRFYVQSAYSVTEPEELEQKKKALLQIDDSFPKYILVKEDINPRRDENGIITVGMINFLLGEAD